MADGDSNDSGRWSGGNYSFSGTTPGLTANTNPVGLNATTPSYSSNTNYGMTTNYGLGSGTQANGLTVSPSTTGQLGELGSTNYGFGGLGTDYGFNPGNYNIGGELGQGLGTLADISRYSSSPMNYGFNTPSSTGYTMAGRPNVGFSGTGNEGLHALASNAPGYTLSQGATGLGIGGNDKEASGWDHPAVKLMRTILGFTPYGSLANLGINALQGKDIGSNLIGMASPGLGGAIAGSAYNAARSSDPLGSAITSGAGMLGGMLGGQLGSQTLGTAANGMMQRVNADNQSVGAFGQASPMQAGISSGQNTPKSVQGSGGTDWGQLGSNLASLYFQNKQAGQLADNANSTNTNLQSSMNGLSDMYNPNGAYAQQLKQELARRDAKAGRNSQYGPRSVELQAALAKMQMQAAQSQAGLAYASTANATSTANAQRAQQTALGQTLAQLLGNKDTQGLIKQGYNGLSNLFSSNTSPVVPNSGYQEPSSDNSLYSLWA